MGMTRFTTIISPKGSGTCHLPPQCSWDLYAISDSGARNPALRQRLGFVWLWRMLAAPGKRPRRLGTDYGLSASTTIRFSKSCISRMMGIMR
jgi:hypothetical protein